ncbi:NAD binding rossmann fold [Mycena indigotica]|uniref:NAD binding rossmann fold n=1 Tax=Mycena indigotica TaxID=2126181 RepID=A0A8H6W6S2_9AGAR|nr:NAD binding rossmann fold [Mycena indigotica]KAF7301389.1 NAD binding rossmann fold [Mycena indigotica]
MTLVDIRVELPAFSRTINVQVPDSATILEVKEEISRVCIGSPRVDGQRVIWRGRPLVNSERIQELWKSPEEPRIVHLAVHPSAWASTPPDIPPTSGPTLSTTSIPSFATPPLAPTPSVPSPNRPTALAYASARHEQAVSALEQRPVIPLEAETLVQRSAAIQIVENHGWQWPAILDQEFPLREPGGAKYEQAVIDGKTYLRLVVDEQPTAIQRHAFKVLAMTFPILAIPIPTPTPTQTATVSHAVPDVNALFQQIGVPVARNAANMNPMPPPAPAALEIPLRPLLVPLLFLILRTAVLLYFFAPARKPVFGIMIVLWMLYEVWRPIRQGLARGWNRGAPDGARQNQAPDHLQPQAQQQPQQQPQADAAAGGVNRGGQIFNRPVGARAGGNAANELDQQVDAIFDGLANINIENEQDVFRRNAPEPGLGSKVVTFVSLFVSTLHPAVWNRRRAVLRQRETQIRVDANARAAELDANTEDPEARARIERQQELNAQHEQRPRWLREYIGRVVDGGWVDEAD